MNDRDWDILVTIAEEKNISRAAERLYISQPALSYRLRAIEAEFKAKVFFRTRKGVSLTPQGEQLVSYVKEMILALVKTKERLASFGGKVAGPLRIGSSAVFANYELPPILGSFLQRYPDVEVFLKTGVSRAVVRMFDREETTVAIVRGDYPWTEVKHLLREEPMCLLSCRPLEIEQLPDTPRITYGTDSSLQELVDEWWRQHFFRPPHVSMAVDTMDTCRRMVAHDLGYAILPAIGLGELDQQRQMHRRVLYWANGDPVLRRTWIFCRKLSLELPPVRAFVEYLLEAQPRREAPTGGAVPRRRGRPRTAPRSGGAADRLGRGRPRHGASDA